MHSTRVLPLLVSLLPFLSAAPTPPVDSSVYLTTLHDSLTTSSDVTKRSSIYGTTANELGNCAPVTVIFARGTIEPGNIGYIAGPPFFDALAAIIGGNNLAVQGVPYGATILGYLEGGDPAGSTALAQLTNQAASQCPHTQIILAGYSQGAQLVHNGEAQISAAVASRVKAVVLFGDPYEGRTFPNINENLVDTFCFATDLICEDTVIVDPAHLSYSIDAIPAAVFAASKVSV